MPSFEHRPHLDPFASTRGETSAPGSESAAIPPSLLHATGGLGTDERAAMEALRGDQHHREALVELATQDARTPADRATIAQWSRELDGNNPAVMRGALSQLHGDARADGVVTSSESSALTEWDAEAGRMSFKPVWNTARADNAVADANDKARKKDKSIPAKEASPALSSDIKGIMDGADAARIGANPELQRQRNEFELAVALSPETEQAIAPTLDMMTAKALAYMQGMHGDGEGGINPAQLALLGKAPSERNYAGAVGTNHEDLLAVLGGQRGPDGQMLPRGNTREVMVALSEFQEQVLGRDVMSEDGLARMQEVFGKGEGAFGPADIERLTQRREDYEAELPAGATGNAKGLFSPLGGMHGPHAGYLGAKEEKHDTKLPSFTAAAIETQLGSDKAAELKGRPASGIGEGSILARTDRTISGSDNEFRLSDREKRQAMRANEGTNQGDRLPWNTGSRANMVDPTANFIAGANEASMPLKAGISGTTARGMGLFDALGADPAMARLALHSQLNQIDAHSFHEVASAAQGYVGADSPAAYSPAAPYSGMGLSQDQLREIAARKGLSFDALNNGARTS